MLDNLKEKYQEQLQLTRENITKGKKVLYYYNDFIYLHLNGKNNKRVYRNNATGKSFLGVDGKLKQRLNTLQTKLEIEAERQLDGPIDCLTHVVAWFHFEHYWKMGNVKKEDWPQRSKNMPDLDNLISGPLDSLQKANVITDDRNIMSFDGTRKLPGDKNRLELWVMEYAPEEYESVPW